MLRAVASISALALLTAAVATASWTAVDKVKFAEETPVIVVGEVVLVAGIVSEAKASDYMRTGEFCDVSDRASIRVGRVIRNALSDVELAVGDIVTANIAPVRYGTSVGSDIRYDVGDEGVWLFRVTEDGDFTIRCHPIQRLGIEDLKEINSLVPIWKSEQRISVEAWVAKHGPAWK